MPKSFKIQSFIQLILVVAVLSFAFWNLGSGSLKPWDEALTGERVREMASNGDFLTPHLYEKPDFNKPPLYYILSVPVFYLTGGGVFAIRFWSVIFAIGCAVLAYFCVVSTGLKRIWGILAALLLLSNPHWQNWTRMGLLDSGFALSILGGLRLLSGPDLSRRQALWGGIILAAGSLLKAPLVLLVIPCVILANLLRYRRLAWRNLILAATMAIGIVLAWSLLQFAFHGQAWLDFQKYNFIERFTTNVEGHATSSWVYWSQLMDQVRFQTFLFLGAILGTSIMNPRGFRRCAPELIFLLAWIALMVISASKRTTYLLPAYPFIAVITAILLGQIFKGTRKILVVVIILCVSVINMVDHYNFDPDYSPHMKSIASYISDNQIEDGFLVTSVRMERQVLAFYTHDIPGKLKYENLLKWTKNKKNHPGKGGYLVVLQSETNKTQIVLIQELNSIYFVELAVQNGRFTAFKLTPVLDNSSVQILYRDGWFPQREWGRWAMEESVTMEAFRVPFPCRLVVKAASWFEDQEPVEFDILIDGKTVGSMEFNTEMWEWQEEILELPGSGTRTIKMEFQFPRRFQDNGKKTWRALPVSEIRFESCLDSISQ